MKSILDLCQVNKKLPYHEDYAEIQENAEFCDASVEQKKEEYLGMVINKFVCEEQNEFSDRLKITGVRNYIRPIVDKMLGSIYRQYPHRPFEATPIGQELASDANAMGKSMNELMQYMLKDALIEGVCYAMPDTTNDSPGYISVAQQKLQGIRPFIRYIESENVINWTEIEGSLTEVIVLFERDDGYFARYYNNTDYVEMEINNKLIVQSIGEVTPHGYEFLPVCRLVPTEEPEVSFVTPLADIQAEIHNLNSLLATEIAENVYTRWIITGARPPDPVDGVTPPTTFGVKRITFLQDDAKLQSMGSDTAQAATITQAIKDAEQALLKASGLASSTYQTSNVPESGISRLVARENWYTICSQIKNAVEQFENQLIYLLATANGVTPEATVYSDSFSEPDRAEDLANLRDLLALAIPDVAKANAIREFVSKYFSFTDQEEKMLAEQLSTKENINNPI